MSQVGSDADSDVVVVDTRPDGAPPHAFAKLKQPAASSSEKVILDFYFGHKYTDEEGVWRRPCRCGKSARCSERKGARVVASVSPLWSHLMGKVHKIIKEDRDKEMEAIQMRMQAGELAMVSTAPLGVSQPAIGALVGGSQAWKKEMRRLHGQLIIHTRVPFAFVAEPAYQRLLAFACASNSFVLSPRDHVSPLAGRLRRCSHTLWLPAC